MKRARAWTEAEYAVLRPYYPQSLGYGELEQLLTLLPGRTRNGIKFQLCKMRKEARISVAVGPRRGSRLVPQQDEPDPPPAGVLRGSDVAFRRCPVCGVRHKTLRYVFRCKLCRDNADSMSGAIDPLFRGLVR